MDKFSATPEKSLTIPLKKQEALPMTKSRRVSEELELLDELCVCEYVK